MIYCPVLEPVLLIKGYQATSMLPDFCRLAVGKFVRQKSSQLLLCMDSDEWALLGIDAGSHHHTR